MNNLERLPDAVTMSGQLIYFDDPSKTNISLYDIISSARNICRYNGAIKWSLLGHLLFCYYIAESPYIVNKVRSTFIMQKNDSEIRNILWYLKTHAFAHDFHEIYVGDMVSGLKKHCPDFQRIENSWEMYVLKKINLLTSERQKRMYQEIKPILKEIDLIALVNEMSYFKHPGLVVANQKHFENNDICIQFHSLIDRVLTELDKPLIHYRSIIGV